MKKTVSGNEALAYGALHAGVKVVSGYPGTPSSEVISSLLKMDLPGTAVEWSVNEKVAFEVAAGAAWCGQRSLCTMKMSGLNVCYDSLIGVAYTGCKGGLVVYVADDPGVTAGMPEQDSRGFAFMSDMPMLEPASVEDAYNMVQYAFKLSEEIQGPVFIRLVTNNALSHAAVDIEERILPDREAAFIERDIAKYTKAGAVICMTQHRELIGRLEKAEQIMEQDKINRLSLKKRGGIGVISAGIVGGYLSEAMETLALLGTDVSGISTLRLAATVPLASLPIKAILEYCSTIVICEELEPHLEKYIYMTAYKQKLDITIIGKEDGTYSRIGEYDSATVIKGICKALEIDYPVDLLPSVTDAEKNCTARPIGFCAGCPHRGTYMGLAAGLKKLGYKKDDVMITGDIGCTILGISPPFHILWTELAMGASIPLAQGAVYAGIETPLIATIGDSTFFHGGMPGLLNAIQHHVDITVIILDNGWTAMTGMQVNPGTESAFQLGGWRQSDIESVLKGFHVDELYVVDSYDYTAVTEAVQKAVPQKGVKVILARRECAIQSGRRKIRSRPVIYNEDKCTKCKQCINLTGCPAISLAEKGIARDKATCNECGLCTYVCRFDALVKE
ncbi:thiamine pyrophosphate-dependent enzyme [Lachnospiraceae bacterium 54-53]